MWAVLPAKDLVDAKQRLADALSPGAEGLIDLACLGLGERAVDAHVHIAGLGTGVAAAGRLLVTVPVHRKSPVPSRSPQMIFTEAPLTLTSGISAALIS